MSQITTHILDTTLGKPAAGVTIALAAQTEGGDWQELSRGITDADGRLKDLLPPDTLVRVGVYRLTFFTKEYAERNGTRTFYPLVEICFEVTSAEHYHVPLLLNPFGYSTYRGS
jgi:5-hydroxyisourate hydrolase